MTSKSIQMSQNTDLLISIDIHPIILILTAALEQKLL